MRVENGGKSAHAIDVRLRSAGELFASLDPSPLVERDIDNAVEEYIVDSAFDAPGDAPLALILHLAAPPSAAETGAIGESVRNYFAFMAEREARRAQHLMRDGRQALAMGLLFLMGCTAAGQAATVFPGGAIGAFLREGLLIIGWVANWRPVQIFLYDWRPIHRRRRIYERLARLTVEVRADQPAAARRQDV